MKLYLLIFFKSGMYASGNHKRLTNFFGKNIVDFRLCLSSFVVLVEMNICGSSQNISIVNFKVIVLSFSSILLICILLKWTRTSVVSFFGGGLVSLLYPEGIQIKSLKQEFELTTCILKKNWIMTQLPINFMMTNKINVGVICVYICSTLACQCTKNYHGNTIIKQNYAQLITSTTHYNWLKCLLAFCYS